MKRAFVIFLVALLCNSFRVEDCFMCSSQPGCSISELWSRLGKGLQSKKPYIQFFANSAKINEQIGHGQYPQTYETADGTLASGRICGAVLFGSVIFRSYKKNSTVKWRLRKNFKKMEGLFIINYWPHFSAIHNLDLRICLKNWLINKTMWITSYE